MGIILGYICLICFCLLCAKAVTAKLHLTKMDKLLMKAHKSVSACFVMVCFLHILFVIPVLQNRNIFVTISGIASAALMLMLICLCHLIKNRTKKILWHRILTFFMAICIIGHFVIYIIDFHNYQQAVADIHIDSVDLGNAADGVYEGECDAGYIYARVKVTVKDGAIISIKLLEHRNERGERAESIIDDVLDRQNIDVDAISGATNSSNVIKKAIENAIDN